MKLFTPLICLAFLSGSQLAFVVAAAIEQTADESLLLTVSAEVLPGYPVEHIKFNEVVDAEVYKLSGIPDSAQAEIMAKVSNKELETRDNTIAVHRDDVNVAYSVLSKRTGLWPPLCTPVNGQPWRPANWDMMHHCANHFLRPINKYFHFGPRVCTWACCRGNAQVWVCNDRDELVTPHSSHIADLVNVSCNECSKGWNGIQEHVCGGQTFDDLGFNVVFRWGPERCNLY